MTVPHGTILACTSEEATSRQKMGSVQTLVPLGDLLALLIPCIAVIFLDLNVQERAKGWRQVNLVLEEIPM